MLNIVLIKSQRKASECWKSLLVDEYVVDSFTFMEMEKKLTLERFQSEVKVSSGIKTIKVTPNFGSSFITGLFTFRLSFFLCRILALTLVEQKSVAIIRKVDQHCQLMIKTIKDALNLHWLNIQE